MNNDQNSNRGRRGGFVSKLLVAAMAGALAGGVAACESSKDASDTPAAQTETAAPKTADQGDKAKTEATAGAAKTMAADKKEGANSCKGANGCGDKAAAKDKEGKNGCGNGCGGAAKDKEGQNSCA